MAKEDFIYEELPKDRFYDLWLEQIDKLERLTISTGPDDRDAVDNSLDLGFRLFPLLDSISFNLFGKGAHEYLEKLGYPRKHAALIYNIFRNGLLHNTNSHRLAYDDGDISWAMSSTSGSGGFSTHNPGYVSEQHPEDNFPPDSAFEYEDYGNGIYYASLSLGTLAAQIRHDLLHRKAEDGRELCKFIVGKRIEGNRPKPIPT